MRQLYALGEKSAMDLSLSENPLGCSALLEEKLKSRNFVLSDYPLPNGVQLKAALAQKFSSQSQNFFIANGSESIIQDIPRVFAKPGDEALVPQLTFPMCAICSELADLKVRAVPMDEQLGINLLKTKEMITSKTKLIFLCNPNNPTGSVIPKEKLTDFLDQVSRDILIVIDEANIEFGGESMVDEALTRSNVLVLRTFSKGFGLASLRIGFAVGNEELITKLEEETAVFPVSGVSEELAIVALQDENFLAMTKQYMNTQRELLSRELQALGFTVFPSQANNLFVRLPESISVEKFWMMIAQSQISLVKGASFAGFDNSYFRVSPRREKTNKAFLKAIAQVIKGKV